MADSRSEDYVVIVSSIGLNIVSRRGGIVTIYSCVSCISADPIIPPRIRLRARTYIDLPHFSMCSCEMGVRW